MKAVMDDDREDGLVARAQEGNLSAYAELVRRYRERIYQTIYHLTRNHDDTDDLAQETFLRAFQGLRRFRRKSGFYTWLYRIAVNLSFNLLNKRKTEMSRQKEVERVSDLKERSLGGPEAASAAGELRERLEAAV
ncbi:MAG: sigma-70 family RNA polymerase sigma factor, partial [Candidatus Aminicenantes bacterium]|nr:sigma-70 family RNA polymerase sigma factor [Candidatus Aminicenantes bacterium]